MQVGNVAVFFRAKPALRYSKPEACATGLGA